MKLAIRISMAILVAGLISCSGGGGGGGQDSGGDDDRIAQCTQDGKNKFVYDLLNDSYLWYDQVEQDVDHTAYSSSQVLLDSVTPDIDRWSYVAASEDFYQYQDEGRYPGMGLAVEFDGSMNLWVRFVYPESPAEIAGISRTDRIVSINGRLASSLPNVDAVWDEVYLYATASVEVQPLIGDTRTEILTWDWVTISPVLHREVFQVGATTVGYLVFNSFIAPAEAALDAAFDDFSQQGIDELILDLRYNGGGRLAIARNLASRIAGENANGEIFKKIIHNDKYRQDDVDFLFTMPANALGLNRVFVISTDNTCSASESVIIGLSPFIDVIQVGGTTCGKPVGMYAHDFCDLVILPIEFRGANAIDEGNYFGGLPPACPAVDDLTRQFGDQEEDSLGTAISYVASGSCPVRSRSMMAFPGEAPVPVNELTGFRRELGAF